MTSSAMSSTGCSRPPTVSPASSGRTKPSIRESRSCGAGSSSWNGWTAECGRVKRGGIAVEIQSQKLSDFFNVGRDRGWDIEKQRWTVHMLINPEGLTLTLGEFWPAAFPSNRPSGRLGARMGNHRLGGWTLEPRRTDLLVENVFGTRGTSPSN